MAIYVNNDNSLQLPQPITRECPHCGAHAQLLPLATPSFHELDTARPRHVGLVFRCAACSEPRFLRTSARAYTGTRIELSPNPVEIEKPRERFPFSYLPPEVETRFSESLECYAAGCYNAFASMCRRTLQATHASLGRNAGIQWRERFSEVVRIGELDHDVAATLEAVLFGADVNPPELSRDQAGVLLETLKDMFYQCYVRTSRLRGAMRMRRYFAGEQERNITPLKAARHARSA